MDKTETVEERKYMSSLNSMGDKIPENRKTLESHNIRWFLRSGAILLRDLPESEYAVHLAKKILNSRE